MQGRQRTTRKAARTWRGFRRATVTTREPDAWSSSFDTCQVVLSLGLLAPAPLVLSVSAGPRIQRAEGDKDRAQSSIERCFIRYSQQSQQDPTDQACRSNQQRQTKDEKKGSKPFVQARMSDTQRSLLSFRWIVHAGFSCFALLLLLLLWWGSCPFLQTNDLCDFHWFTSSFILHVGQGHQHFVS
jgi:hypothetical protein